jgi:hypothetical protein
MTADCPQALGGCFGAHTLSATALPGAATDNPARVPPRSLRQRFDLLSKVAERQEATVSRAQLSACGYERDAIRRRTEAGDWQLTGRAFVLHNGQLSNRNLQWAAVLSVKGPAAICGRTAAANYRLRGFESDVVHVVVTKNAKVPHIDDVEWHESRRFTTADITPGYRLPTVRPARAIVDAAAWTSQPRLACALLIASVQQRVTRVPDLRAALGAAGEVRHCAQLRLVLSDIAGGADSLAEIDLTKLARRAGLPPPLRQSVRIDADGKRRYLDVDFGAFSVEVDGGVHLRPLNFWADARRQNDLIIGGERILRFPSVAIRLEEDLVVAQLRRAGIVFGLIRH